MLTLPFNKLKATDANIAGGKGASLGELTQAGIPVPPGFVILSGTFDRFIEEAHLAPEIEAILHTVDHREIHTVDSASEKIQALIKDAAMPAEIASRIMKDFSELGAEFVAVRSSATSEDSAEAAWAGQLDTYLNTTEGQVLKNVQRCWASLFTPRAIFYRFEKGLHDTRISVAVVVQKMVASEVSGIAFSVHPVTQDRSQMIIEAGFGLGEAIVSGQVTPDSYVVDKGSFAIMDKSVAEQRRMMVRGAAGGSEWTDMPPAEGARQALSDEQIVQLARTILLIEEHYGFPCDIEWALEKGAFYIVQSRPITTLGSVPQEPAAASDKEDYERHQRDYSLLATTTVFQALFSGELQAYFSYAPKPMYVLVEKGILYHFYSEEDTQGRARGFLGKHTLNELKEQKQPYAKLLGEYRTFLRSDDLETAASIQRIHEYFGEMLPLFLVAMEVPECAGADEGLRDFCLDFRREIEDIYKIGFDRHSALLGRLEEERGLPPGTLGLLTIEEFDGYLRGNSLPPGLEERRDFILIEESGSGIKIFNDRGSLRELGLVRDETLASDEFKGNIAFPGKVTGRVRIIKLVQDAALLQEGEVLVASMTDPRYVPSMRQAAAIVTDEGGITCHAAIVSRELKKPCIIGTKIATQVLHDGDMVEVDADKGVVRILEGA